MAGPPAVLIADEPTTALDATVQAQYLALLKEVQRESGLAILFVTHDFGIVANMCDRVAVMYAGRIVEVAPVRELFERPAHPYTQALLSAIPTYGRQRGRRLVLVGDLPSPIDPPAYCRFASRCPRRIDRCTQEDPPLAPEVGPGHEVACFNWTTREERAPWLASRSTS
jgi:oligopeptide/dipeptide ABC transporter ATP-binding protein